MNYITRGIIIIVMVAIACVVTGNRAKSQGAFTITSAAFIPDDAIPKKYTCQGSNTPLPLAWRGAPAGTKSFALVMDDPDARPVVGYTWVHWVVYNIPAVVNAIPEKLSRAAAPSFQADRQSRRALRAGTGRATAAPAHPRERVCITITSRSTRFRPGPISRRGSRRTA